jgi:hypothetical protein
MTAARIINEPQMLSGVGQPGGRCAVSAFLPFLLVVLVLPAWLSWAVLAVQ